MYKFDISRVLVTINADENLQVIVEGYRNDTKKPQSFVYPDCYGEFILDKDSDKTAEIARSLLVEAKADMLSLFNIPTAEFNRHIPKEISPFIGITD